MTAFKAARCNHKCGCSSNIISFGKITWVGREANPEKDCSLWGLRGRLHRTKEWGPPGPEEKSHLLYKVAKISVAALQAEYAALHLQNCSIKILLARQKEKHLLYSRAAVVSNKAAGTGSALFLLVGGIVVTSNYFGEFHGVRITKWTKNILFYFLSLAQEQKSWHAVQNSEAQSSPCFSWKDFCYLKDCGNP